MYVLLYSLPDYVYSSGRDILHYNLTAHGCPIDSARVAGTRYSERQMAFLLLDCTDIVCVYELFVSSYPHDLLRY